TLQPMVGKVSAAELPADLGEFRKSTPDHAVFMPDNEWLTVRIVDDGKTISVFISPAGHAEDQAAALAVPSPVGSSADHIAVYNRELLGSLPHESHIRNFTVRTLPLATPGTK